MRIGLFLPIFTAALNLSMCCNAASSGDIELDNAHAVVFVQKINAKGEEIMAGSGMIVSHDGYVITANHLSPDSTNGEKLIATIGQRVGTTYALELRDKDADKDVALWQLPQASSCRASVTIDDKQLDDNEGLVALGFPGNRGLSRAILHITNVHSPGGLYATDGALEEGYSGGPVFNQGGKVVGFVQGGTISGARDNDLVPIAIAISILKKLGVSAAIGSSAAYPNSCYTSCRAPENGIERWLHEEPWSANSGEVGGGHNEPDMCAGLIAGKLATSPSGARVDLDNTGGMSEDKKKDALGHVTRIYYCKGTLRYGVIYKEARSSVCPLWE